MSHPAPTPMIAVVGSLNMDLVVPVPHHPAPGETVLGGDLARHPGGKGANQAVAAARAGGRVAMVGRVGDDADGTALAAVVRGEGVDTTHLLRTAAAPTGQALITVDQRGENSIVVSPGANSRLTIADVEAAVAILRQAKVTLLQQEIPADTNDAAALASGGMVIYNPAPATPGTEPPPGVNVLIPNRAELAALAGTPIPGTPDEVLASARRLTGISTLIVTLGAEGVLLIEARAHHHIPAFPVTPLDTTAAGDTFCGALAVALSEGQSLGAAARWACAAAAISTTRRGALPSIPHREEIDSLVAAHR